LPTCVAPEALYYPHLLNKQISAELAKGAEKKLAALAELKGIFGLPRPYSLG